jgi:RNA polymerase sigma factor (sigma-70 family)
MHILIVDEPCTGIYCRGMLVSLQQVWFGQNDSDAGTDRWERRETHARSSCVVPGRISESEIVARVRLGDEAVFDALFRTEFPRLVGYGTAIIGSQDLAEDIAGEVFTRIWCRHADWDPQGPIGAYLFRAVRNQAYNVQRSGRRAETFRRAIEATEERPGMGTVVPATDIEADHAKAIAALWQAIDALPAPRREVAYLRWHEGMEYKDIAEVTRQSAAAVKMQVSRTLAMLRRLVPALID